ncbi:DUF1107 family protein [Thaumasiovibrio sp. DFM-14]|uniref:DUF1107 family protein n=1 Tax=Thaumasiovibrio sp. DFM-14 TaxID=3384792 RepID=UPI0039A02538
MTYREFTHFRPQQIARFVKSYYKGSFSILGMGEFSFEHGKVMMPDSLLREHLMIMAEINKEIKLLSKSRAA